MDTIEYRPAKSPYKLIPMPMASPAKLLNDATTVMVKSSFPDRKCSKCHSQRTVTGSVSDSRRGPCFFAQAALKFWKITSSYGTKVESYACIDCGQVWMQR